MDDCTTGVFGSSVSSSVQVSAAVVYHIASFFTSQAHSSISASPGKSLRIFMCRELYSQLTPVYKSSIRFSSLLWRIASLLLSCHSDRFGGQHLSLLRKFKLKSPGEKN